MALAVEVRGLVKTFPAARPPRFGGGERRREVEALRGLDLEVRRGEVLALLGANGSGKTTLLEVLAARLLPTAGRARVDGGDTARDPLHVRRAVGYCPAGARGLDPRLPLRANLEFFAVLARLPGCAARERVETLWQLAGLDAFPDVPAGKASDGMRQRLSLARALLLDPPVLLLDEPTRALDPATAEAWGRLIRGLAADGKAVLLTTHRPEEAERTCDRVAVLDRGRIAAEPPLPGARAAPAAGAPRALIEDAV